MNLLIEGDRLCGKTTVAQAILSIDHSFSVIENRFLTDQNIDVMPRSEIVDYYGKLNDLLVQPSGKFILIRGPLFVFASSQNLDYEFAAGLISPFAKRGDKIAYLDIGYETYTTRFERFVAAKGYAPCTRLAFDRRRERYHQLLGRHSCIRAISLDGDDYEAAAQQLIGVTSGESPD